MTTQEKTNTKQKILKGLELTYQKLLIEKRAKGQKLVVIRDKKIVEIEP
jgi:hypothetical protein